MSSRKCKKIEKISKEKERRETTEEFARLYPPLRDAQQCMPKGVCPRCGREQYRYDRMIPVGGGLWCAACAAREEEERTKQ